jgi:hypothetical protein
VDALFASLKLAQSKNEGYHAGEMLEGESFPTEAKGWLLSSGHFPVIAGLTPETQPKPLGDRILQSWPEYYEWRGLPADSIAAMLLHYPLSLYRAVTSCPRLLGLKRLVIEIVGVERQLEMIPLFAELAYLLSNEEIVITMFGPSVVNLKERTAGSPKSLAQRKHPMFSHEAVVAGIKKVVCVMLNSVSPKWQNTFMHRYNAEVGPDLVFGWLTSYRDWYEVLFRSAGMRCHFASTEYTEQSLNHDCSKLVPTMLEQAGRDYGKMLVQDGPVTTMDNVEIGINPFRDPGQRRFPISKLPNFLNGFLLTIIPEGPKHN